MDIIEQIKNEVIKSSKQYEIESIDHYNFWNEHIKYVYEESLVLASKYNADIEIVSLGALLHDIALIKKVGTREEHHINSKTIALEILTKYKYPKEKLDRVLGCIYNHRSSKNATNIEEICVCDADILAHFDNMPMLFNSAYKRHNKTLNNVREFLRECFEKDYNDLSDMTKNIFKDKYMTICDIVLGDNYEKNNI